MVQGAINWTLWGLGKSCIYSNISLLFRAQSALSRRCGSESEWGNWRQRLLYVRFPTAHFLIYFVCSPPTLSLRLPLLARSLILPLSMSSLLSLHNYLLWPVRWLMAFIWCPLLPFAEQQQIKPGPNTQIVPQKSRKTWGNTGAVETMKQRDLAFGKKNICWGTAWNNFLCSLSPQRNPPTANLQLLLLPTAVSKLKRGGG